MRTYKSDFNRYKYQFEIAFSTTVSDEQDLLLRE